MKCYLYVIWDGFAPNETNYIKLGISDRPHQRIRSLQSGNPKILHIHRLHEFKNREQAFSVEQILLENLSSIKAHGEWLRYHDKVDSLLDGASLVIGKNCVNDFVESDIYTYYYYREMVGEDNE